MCFPSRSQLVSVLLLCLLSCVSKSVSATRPAVVFSAFGDDESSTRRWVGPKWWANPLWDWRLQNGAAVGACAKPARTLCALPLSVNENGVRFSLSADVTFSRRTSGSPAGAAGFRIGRRGQLEDYRNALVIPTRWMDATVSSYGALKLGTRSSNGTLPLRKYANSNTPVRLMLFGVVMGGNVAMQFDATFDNGEVYKKVSVQMTVPLTEIRGGVSLLTKGGFSNIDDMTKRQEARFKNFKAQGSLFTYRASRQFGPVFWTQYTVSSGELRLQAQLAPRWYPGMKVSLHMQTGSENWRFVQSASVQSSTWTALFVVRPAQWTSSERTKYSVMYRMGQNDFNFTGLIKPEPMQGSKQLKLAVFSCDRGYTFPNSELVQYVLTAVKPHIIFFAGDQIYENIGDWGKPKRIVGMANAAVQVRLRLDFLFKYARFGWMWRDVLRRIPSILLPDDHDVYHANLWGAGGVALRPGQDLSEGGYRMQGSFVSAVQRIQSGHLPSLWNQGPLAVGTDPNRTLPIGIKPLYTAVLYGGVSFAVLEDRKFKAGPLQLGSEVRKEQCGGNAPLLGAQQERFLRNWASHWGGHVMKVALSQTMFGTVATHTGPFLRKSTFVYDNGGWPCLARNRVIHMLKAAGALSVHGDQHLGMLARMGVDSHDDGNVAFMVPGNANGWPRAWWPNGPEGGNYTGKFVDPNGAPMHVVAVGNPTKKGSMTPFDGFVEDPLNTALQRGSGFGVVRLFKSKRAAQINLFRVGPKAMLGTQFPGFPKTVTVSRVQHRGEQTAGAAGGEGGGGHGGGSASSSSVMEASPEAKSKSPQVKESPQMTKKPSSGANAATESTSAGKEPQFVPKTGQDRGAKPWERTSPNPRKKTKGNGNGHHGAEMKKGSGKSEEKSGIQKHKNVHHEKMPSKQRKNGDHTR